MNDDLGIDISSTKLPYIACRGSKPVIIHKSKVEVANTLIPRYRTYIMFSGHGLTHLDLPGPLQETIDEIRTYDGSIKPLPAPEEFAKLVRSKYLSARTVDGVILDITQKRELIDEFIDGEFLKTDIAQYSFENLMTGLEVRWNDLVELQARNLLRGRILILKTGWERLAERDMDISDPYFEFRHPYLVHPYLTMDTLRKILDEGVEGVGTDAYCLENPAYFTIGRSVPEYASHYLERFATHNRKQFLPVLVTLLTEFKVYLKNLRGLYQKELQTVPREYICGKSTIVPVDFGDTDMCLAKVFFKREV